MSEVADLTPYRVGAIPIDTDLVVSIAQAQGFFGRNGIEAEIQFMRTGPDISAGIVSGDLIFGSSDTMSIASAHQKGAGLKIIAPGAAYSSRTPTTQMMVLKTGPINDVRDLNGKTVAINVLKGIAHIATMAWIDKH